MCRMEVGAIRAALAGLVAAADARCSLSRERPPADIARFFAFRCLLLDETVKLVWGVVRMAGHGRCGRRDPWLSLVQGARAAV